MIKPDVFAIFIANFKLVVERLSVITSISFISKCGSLSLKVILLYLEPVTYICVTYICVRICFTEYQRDFRRSC